MKEERWTVDHKAESQTRTIKRRARGIKEMSRSSTPIAEDDNSKHPESHYDSGRSTHGVHSIEELFILSRGNRQQRQTQTAARKTINESSTRTPQEQAIIRGRHEQHALSKAWNTIANGRPRSCQITTNAIKWQGPNQCMKNNKKAPETSSTRYTAFVRRASKHLLSGLLGLLGDRALGFRWIRASQEGNDPVDHFGLRTPQEKTKNSRQVTTQQQYRRGKIYRVRAGITLTPLCLSSLRFPLHDLARNSRGNVQSDVEAWNSQEETVVALRHTEVGSKGGR